jgi:hypothetical protein
VDIAQSCGNTGQSWREFFLSRYGGFSALILVEENGWNHVVELMFKHGAANGFKLPHSVPGRYARALA